VTGIPGCSSADRPRLPRARRLRVGAFELPAREVVNEENAAGPAGRALEDRTELAHAKGVADEHRGAIAHRRRPRERVDDLDLVTRRAQPLDDEPIVDVPACRLPEVPVRQPHDPHGLYRAFVSGVGERRLANDDA
jgi:hypothetical protein